MWRRAPACRPSCIWCRRPAPTDCRAAPVSRHLPSVITALLLGIVSLLLAFGPTGAMVTMLLLLLVALVLARVATRQFGGQTGDVLGALEQIGEAAILLVSASLF